ncbi:cytochrome c biogenesis protein ResB [Bdellovibrio bacteriovorus]|uniref:Putative membrane protein n=1 Tax=Bdellovibrio bacteriovorus (strain ATCC 15356 / DSM 50701 / NCIMB 9529 / HD100) TaxID=264462 RepID=Q6MJF2_BDEBA|nr:cytochrome c biogenesis protein ResB [Bdellovibrio bacteriovorus]CAE80608.1 putative membrane protein [Bdellovibrio bacteriovorus HD100]
MLRSVLRFFASLKLAVVIIASLALLISVGTFVEARFDAWTAKQLVYNSVWMYGALGLLVTSLVAVIADRWPWQPRHAAFIFAHVGIIMIIFGALLTQTYGVDGIIRLTRTAEAVNEVQLQDTQLTVYRSRTGDGYDKVYSEDVNFLKNPITAKEPFLIKAKGLHFELLESIPYGLAQTRIEASPAAQSGSAVRFQLANANVSEIDWLIQRNAFERAEKQIGPVLLTMGGLWERRPEINEIRLYQNEDQQLSYALYSKNSQNPYKKGTLAEGDRIQTAWMGLELRTLQFLIKAVQKYEVRSMDRPTPATRASLKVRYNGQESFLVLNDYIKVFTDDWVYLIAYHNKKIPLGFDIALRNFKKTDYPGTMRAMAYESEVQFADQRATISMNEPLKHQGYYIYQASFEESPNGGVTASILSVNRDPGRVWKYLGSLVMCVGILLLFYFRYRPHVRPRSTN